jgi:hypothetical protein
MGNSINIQETIEKARKQIENEPDLSPALKATFDLLINLCLFLAQKWRTKDILPDTQLYIHLPETGDDGQ